MRIIFLLFIIFGSKAMIFESTSLNTKNNSTNSFAQNLKTNYDVSKSSSNFPSNDVKPSINYLLENIFLQTPTNYLIFTYNLTPTHAFHTSGLSPPNT